MSMVEKLTYLKRQHKLTTEKIATRCHIPVGTLNKIFAGQTHNPSLTVIYDLCRVFNVPFSFLMEDDVPNECTHVAYAQSKGIFPVSQQELALFEQFRLLSERDRDCVAEVIRQYTERIPARDPVESERLLPCYRPIALGHQGFYSDTWDITTVRVPLDQVSRDADFALVIFSDELAPFYQEGDILAVKRRSCTHGQLGVFLLNSELFIRRLNRKCSVIKLVPLKTGNPVITIAEQDDMRCLGLVTGILRESQSI